MSGKSRLEFEKTKETSFVAEIRGLFWSKSVCVCVCTVQRKWFSGQRSGTEGWRFALSCTSGWTMAARRLTNCWEGRFLYANTLIIILKFFSSVCQVLASLLVEHKFRSLSRKKLINNKSNFLRSRGNNQIESIHSVQLVNAVWPALECSFSVLEQITVVSCSRTMWVYLSS